MIKLRAHETDVTAAINSLVNDVNVEVGALAGDFVTLQRSVASALVDLHKRLSALDAPQIPTPRAVPDTPATSSGTTPPDAPVPTL